MDADSEYRTQVVRENADEDTELFVPMHESWPEWHCEDCGTRNDGWRLNCALCGDWRDDIDACVSNG